MAHNAETERAEFKEETAGTLGKGYRLNPRIGEAKQIHLDETEAAQRKGPVSAGLTIGTGPNSLHIPYLRFDLPERGHDEDGREYLASTLVVNPDFLEYHSQAGHQENPHRLARHLRVPSDRLDRLKIVTKIT